jgi:hypothetical protein
MVPTRPWITPLTLRIFGLLCLALAVWMYMPRRPATPPTVPAAPPARLCEAYPGGFADATLAIELARTPADVDCIVSLARPGSIARGLRWDRFVIALYWSILTCLGLLFLRSGLPGSFGLGLAAAVSAAGGAIADMLENRGISALLAGARDQGAIDAVRIACYWKWWLLAVAFGLILVFLIRRGRWTWIPGLFFLLATAGLVLSLLIPGWLPYLQETLTAMSLALFTSVLLFIFHPRSLV